MEVGKWIYHSPAARTAIPVFSSISIGLFTSLLVSEMTESGTVDWWSFYRHVSFYILVFSGWATYRFHKMLYNFDKEVERFKDADYCTAFARSQLIPSHLEEAKAAIKSGNTKRFEDAMEQVKKVL